MPWREQATINGMMYSGKYIAPIEDIYSVLS